MKIVSTIAFDSRGATILEFALVLPILLLLIFGTLEFCFMLYQRSIIETVTHDVARRALTGNSYGKAGPREEELTNELTNKINSVVIGDGEVEVSSEVFSNLSTLQSSANTPGSTFGGSDQIVRYQIRYHYPLITPLPILMNGMEDEMILTATAFVKNEAF